ncbi:MULTISPECIES: RrF2 family transcriptional regulator [Clostridium]|uniref:HTH-type transcriptional regulator CymR n=2 Tax=Clostridium TaxID=1485 RepID=A0A151AP78_9CLOT|nr:MULTISPECIES: Rrf2 family transcriptional regulator [Clostridium]KYH29429.1 HTH-type transcriptional regulator CymR [Clostridium colicanis DSM 13634]MBE6044035.1 Rrf2 family transcriptional regulator [Clostridium thermopalmarium]PRR70789.1 HTH-type transcriptional regulator CymR [Clostridium thermopalmarium DSM 5974]PVZ28713.1 BadM/Rrf2 family transcriptional regulator [Clostridium thermopalmarium DSM 5974]
MKISTKGRYGLKAMVDLALYSSSESSITLKSISERQNISERYLEQIFSVLRKNDLVKSIKGPQGGYMLSKPAKYISVGNILRVLEGELHIVSEEENGDKVAMCIKETVWNKINESIDKIVDSISLEDLVWEYNNSNSEGYMFYI